MGGSVENNYGENAVLVSVIVPFYHGNAYINDLLNNLAQINDSIYTKHNAKLEVIVVNDSPQIKVEISLDTFAKPINIRVIENTKNSGIHQSRVNGLAYAKGKYIVFLDQDDELNVENYHTQLDVLKRTNADVIVGNGIYQYGETDKLIFQNEKVMQYHIKAQKFLDIRNLIPSPGECLIKKNAIPKQWINHPMTQNGADDWLLWVLLFGEGKRFAVNPQLVYIHKDTGGNLSANLGKMYDSSKQMLDILVGTENFDKSHAKRLKRAIDFKYYQDTKGIKPGLVFKYFDVFLKQAIYRIKTNFYAS